MFEFIVNQVTALRKFVVTATNVLRRYRNQEWKRRLHLCDTSDETDVIVCKHVFLGVLLLLLSYIVGLSLIHI